MGLIWAKKKSSMGPMYDLNGINAQILPISPIYTCLLGCIPFEDTYQSAHPRSLIRVFPGHPVGS